MSFVSLERKLPILIGGLVAMALFAALVLVWYELRNNAVSMAGERLALVTAQLDELVEGSVDNRVETIEEVLEGPVLSDYVLGASSDDAVVRQELERLRVASDSGLPIELRALDGTPLVRTGEEGPAAASLAPETGAPSHASATVDSVTYTSLERSGEDVIYHIAAPVVSQGRVIAQVVQRRRVGTSGNGEQIERLIGSQAEIFFTNRDGGVWASLDGDVRTDVPVPSTTGEPFEYEYGGERLLGFASPVEGTNWLLVVQMPLDAALTGTGRVIRRLTLLGLVLLVLGGLGAWIVSRSVTRPLSRLGEAADAIAAGDYERRTGVTRSDEIGHLASSFDTMASRIDSSYSEIARRYEQSQALSRELERANSQLTAAISDAERARTQAQQASRAKSEFLATMSHEIRTPINAVLGYTELMELELPGPLTEQQREYITRVRLSGSHLISLVNDVLDFAKIEAGQLRMEHGPRDIRPDIDAAVSMLQASAEAKNTTLEVGALSQARYIGDPQRVQQILINLLSNAIKFSDEGSHVEITCDLRESQAHEDASQPKRRWACVTVRDNGPGIPAEQLDSIFEPFVQGAGGYTRRHGGTGLGLAISRSLARMMDGDLTADSTPGDGSSFILWLPAA